MKIEDRVLSVLRAVASVKWHGRGCRRSNCGKLCLCVPCQARVLLEEVGVEPARVQTPNLRMTSR